MDIAEYMNYTRANAGRGMGILKKQWLIKIDKKVFVSALKQKAPLRVLFVFLSINQTSSVAHSASDIH